MCWCLTLRGLDQAGGDGPVQAWTARGSRRPGSPTEDGAAGSCSDASVPCFPLPLLWPSSAPPYHLQAKEAPASPLPQVPGGKMGLVFRLLYYELTLPHIKNSSRCPGRLLHS